MPRMPTLVVLGALVSACAAHPGSQVTIHSADYGFVDELLAHEPGTPRRISGQLAVPETGDAPFPAMVLVHSAQGRDAQMWMYAERFNALGIATLTLDSFTQRGIRKILDDQTAVTEASMIADAYAGLRLLAADSRIDPARIGIFGVSKGGAPSIYASMKNIADALAPEGERFALHIAYYPWCGVRFYEPATTGAPLLIQSGAEDHITPSALCAELIGELEAANDNLEAELIVFAGARHAFDHPYLARVPAIPANYLVPDRCLIREVRPGEFREESQGIEVTGATLSVTLAGCSRRGFLVGGNPAAAEAAWANTVRVLGEQRFVSTARDQDSQFSPPALSWGGVRIEHARKDFP